MDFDYDLFVIGGGSGGVRAARLTAADGKKVAMAEEFRMGGTCVIRGCVPKKLMVFASQYSHAADEAAKYGWDIRLGDFDWPSFQSKLKAELSRLEGIYTKNAGNAGVEILHQRATVKDPHTVVLADGTEKTAKHILVAVGGTPFVPDNVPGIEHAITSNEIFDIPELPKRILIVGGGYIACEFACIFNGLGSEVTQYYRGAQILRGFDDEARGHIAELIRGQGVNLHVGTDVERLEKRDGGIWVKATDGREGLFDVVLYATGRKPNTAGLGLEEAGVTLGRGGAVVVDEYSQTNIPSIFAVGDVTDRIQLTPVAIREAVAFHETVFKGNPMKPDHANVPSAIFTQPEYGAVGLTEEQARDEGPVEIYSAAFRPMQNSFIEKNERVMFKLIVCAETRRVLGCHIIAPHAGEMIQLAGVAIKMGATKEDFDATVAVHPTMAEEIVLMKEPVRVHK
ncbi:glutathione-disulfide reductase [Celeribacter halophilus]|uniref:glutathione-disulfide reductase n=1 Tax=Celeribacter halophilus TaxID=576117 RepID=UPI001C097DC5|nr:glutathione-disulfide reductase [Celeribacter halophilus]MBU2891034.1 glutathione-disulfide reductase [Celeribacter halophilus]MDO6511079.1 glutathione-disulfide reductase [Celeribacter halophilus]